MHRSPPPLDDRLEADRPITPELLAVAARQPLELATHYVELWFRVARMAVESDLVLVFDELVIGPPCPLVLEAAFHVRETRRAERRGDFDDEEEHWYDEHGDDDGDDDGPVWEPPTITDRVLAAMASGQEADRLVDGAVVSRAVSRALDPPIAQWIAFIRLAMTMERLLVELADGVRVGGGVVVDARLRGEILDAAARWAA